MGPPPGPDRPAPAGWGDVPALTPESTALAKALKKRGFRFVGPTTRTPRCRPAGWSTTTSAGCVAGAATEARRPVERLQRV